MCKAEEAEAAEASAEMLVIRVADSPQTLPSHLPATLQKRSCRPLANHRSFLHVDQTRGASEAGSTDVAGLATDVAGIAHKDHELIISRKLVSRNAGSCCNKLARLLPG